MAESETYAKIVQDLIDLLKANSNYTDFEIAIQQALSYDIRDIAVLGIVDTDSFLKHANYLVTTWVSSSVQKLKMR
jgi:thiamine pyrophosphokinase